MCMRSFSIPYARTKRLSISNLTLGDALDLSCFTDHTSPLYASYNFSSMSREELVEWYHFKTDSRKNRYYSVREAGRLVGYFGIKEIRRIFRRADFGIVIDAARTGEGFGKEILHYFLPVYFHTFGMRDLLLDVAAFNTGAIRLYETAGFHIVGKRLQKLREEECGDEETIYAHPEIFSVSARGIYYPVWRMAVSERDLDGISI